MKRYVINPLRLMALPSDCANPEDIEWLSSVDTGAKPLSLAAKRRQPARWQKPHNRHVSKRVRRKTPETSNCQKSR